MDANTFQDQCEKIRTEFDQQMVFLVSRINNNSSLARQEAMAKADERVMGAVPDCTFSTLTRCCGCIIERITHLDYSAGSAEPVRKNLLEKEYPCEHHANGGR